MRIFEDHLRAISDDLQRSRLNSIFTMIEETFPHLEGKIAWNQPMYTNHGTFIIAFSTSKNHISVGQEKAEIDEFSARIRHAGYSHGKMLWRIGNNQEVDYDLLKQIISYTIDQKRDCTTFWRH
ncbi:MAG: DUF1801 domain-containing protein [Sphaerochaetaceae bacterium]|nr:DUF1801 domain-containing protein [Sphaerochaetaceae bacterium]